MHNRDGRCLGRDDAVDRVPLPPCETYGFGCPVIRYESDDGRSRARDECVACTSLKRHFDGLPATGMQSDRSLLQMIVITFSGADPIECRIYFRRA